ncbi:MAG: glycerophosphodiester phosphodiesterase [Gammaproteobacteria bacterium]
MTTRAAMVLTAALLIANPAAFGGGLSNVARANENADNAAGVWRARDGRPLVIAHRGGAGLFPENTIAAMRGSAMLGVDVLDMDAQLSNDGVLVAFHDKTLNRTTNGSGEVGNFSYDELAMLNAAAHFRAPDGKQYPPQPIPRIKDILRELAAGDWLFVIEIKNRGDKGKIAAQKLAAIIKELNLQKRVIIGSFGGAPLDAFREALPGAATSASQAEAAGIILLGGFYAPPLVALQIPPSFAGLDLAAKSRMIEWQKRNYAVHYWTINDAAQMAQLITDGADGIFSDYPDTLRKVLADAGHRPPAGMTTTPPAAP